MLSPCHLCRRPKVDKQVMDGFQLQVLTHINMDLFHAAFLCGEGYYGNCNETYKLYFTLI